MPFPNQHLPAIVSQNIPQLIVNVQECHQLAMNFYVVAIAQAWLGRKKTNNNVLAVIKEREMVGENLREDISLFIVEKKEVQICILEHSALLLFILLAIRLIFFD